MDKPPGSGRQPRLGYRHVVAATGDDDDAQDHREEALRWAMRRIEDAVGPIIAVHEQIDGTAPGHRLRATIADLGTVFLKVADGSEWTARAIGGEAALITTVRHRYMPPVIAHGAGDDVPWMVQRDLADAQWPPPWPADLRRVFKAVRRLSRATPPPWLERPGDVDPWKSLTSKPGEEWWRGRSDELAGWSSGVSIAGRDLVHGDLGAGNLCISNGQPIVVDWSDAYVGNGEMDLVTLAVDIAHTEGRRVAPPVKDLRGWLSKVAGLLIVASRREAWPGPGGATVRTAQEELAVTATTWALDIDP